jgi:hypothetical protein
MRFWDWHAGCRIALVALVLAIGGANAWAQDQSNQTQPQQGQPNQSQSGQTQSNQGQANQTQANQTQANQDQENQSQPAQNQTRPDQAKPDPGNPPQTQPPQQPAQEQPQPQNPPENPQPNNAQPNNPTQNPPAQDNDNANPAKQVALQAEDLTKKLGQATLVKVRDWEIGWLTGPYVGREREMVPMTSVQRRDIYLQQTFLAPSDYFKRMFSAAVDQARGTPAQWGGGLGGYGKRFASREGQFIAANSLAALGNAKLKYEPRYDQCRCTGFASRTRHAILRNFLTYNETERELRPQLALYGGAFTGGVIATVWKPHPRNALTNGGVGMLGQAGYGALLNFFTEFAGDINRKLGGKK